MPDPRRALRETSQATHPGWTRLQWVDAADGRMLNTQYRGPGGEIISRRQFRARLASGEIPTIDAATGDLKQPSAAVNDPPSLASASASGGSSASEAAEPFDLPTPQPAPSRATPGQATAAELSLTATIALTILTSLLALITRTPELTMSEVEAQSIGVPLANIAAKSSLNRRFGRYLADSSDYTLLGYALYAYGYRVIAQVGARAQAEAAALGTQRGFPHAVSQSAQSAPAAQSRPAAPAASSGQPAGATGPAGPTGPTGERTAPASGGIGGAVRAGLNGLGGGAVGTEAARIVGYNPLPPAGRS